MNMHRILSSIILCCFLTFLVNIHPVISAVDSKLAYENGSVESSMSTETLPASKDIVYKPEFNLSARLYLPKATAENQKLPLLFYIHGGYFAFGSPFDSTYNGFLNTIVSEANVIAISIEYRLIDVCTLPCQYIDSWDALKWVASHLNGNGPEVWLNQHADFQRVFIAGDSAGANIVHQTALKLGLDQEELEGFGVTGIILCHPYFWGLLPIPGETTDPKERAELRVWWRRACPTCSLNNPWINPARDPNLSRVASPRLQVFVSELDSVHVRERGWYYAQKLRQSGWRGYQEVTDFEREDHVFHLIYASAHNSTILRSKMVSFINQEWSRDSLPIWSNI